MITEPATELALRPVAGSHFNAAIASLAFATDDIGPSHVRKTIILISVVYGVLS